ncbi:hypothetical protein B0J14DRAFT_155108 [Halenospora varia]|nr:hypothetical protein B0J14DRAFT_155108 [Halenospora varia]
MSFPFLFVDVVADGPYGPGSSWVLTNECLGGTTTCINLVERFNHFVKRHTGSGEFAVDSTTFNVAMGGSEACLFVSWLHREKYGAYYYTQKVKSFLLQDLAHFIEFRRYVRNNNDWGIGERLDTVRKALKYLNEKTQQ